MTRSWGRGLPLTGSLPTYCKQPESSQSQEPETQSDSLRRMERTQYWGHHCCLEVYSGIRNVRTQTGTLIPDADTLSSILTTVPNTYAWLPLELMNPYLPHGELGINFWNESLVFCVTAFTSAYGMFTVWLRELAVLSPAPSRGHRNWPLDFRETKTCQGRKQTLHSLVLDAVWQRMLCHLSIVMLFVTQACLENVKPEAQREEHWIYLKGHKLWLYSAILKQTHHTCVKTLSVGVSKFKWLNVTERIQVPKRKCHERMHICQAA